MWSVLSRNRPRAAGISVNAAASVGVLVVKAPALVTQANDVNQLRAAQAILLPALANMTLKQTAILRTRSRRDQKLSKRSLWLRDVVPAALHLPAGQLALVGKLQTAVADRFTEIRVHQLMDVQPHGLPGVG